MILCDLNFFLHSPQLPLQPVFDVFVQLKSLLQLPLFDREGALQAANMLSQFISFLLKLGYHPKALIIFSRELSD